jgi:hypothetical protein
LGYWPVAASNSAFAAEPKNARRNWRQALHILDELHHPDVEQIRAKLKDLNAKLGPYDQPLRHNHRPGSRSRAELLRGRSE